jgi:hypothetical protein
MKFDYSISDWQKLDEDAEYSFYYKIKNRIVNKAFSGSLKIGL